MLQRMLFRPHVGVRCRRVGDRKYVLDDSQGMPVLLVKAGTAVTELGDAVVTDLSGEVLQPSRRFFRTVDTVDPYHIVLDMPG